jgi:hypothetical protein
MAGLRDPIETIRAHLARWERPVVDLDTFGTSEPEAIAEMVDAFCIEHLHSGVAGYLFCTASQGSTHGVSLVDGRRIVVKVRSLPDERFAPVSEADRRLTRLGLASVHRAMEELTRHRFACPRPLVGPTPLGIGIATAETYIEHGAHGDGFEPDCRRVIADGLVRVIRILTPIRDELHGLRPFFQPRERRYPIPHSKLFDFDATSAGAEWIDAIADRARALSSHPGPIVVGHADWRVEHLRFAEGRISASYDWDSVLPLPETQLVGLTAASFTTDWSSYVGGRVPTVQAIRDFVEDYELARAGAFSADARTAIFAMAVYTAAYGARCLHSLEPTRSPMDWPEDSWPGLLRAAANTLLADR